MYMKETLRQKSVRNNKTISPHTQEFVMVISKATYFGYRRQTSSGFTFQKYIKKINPMAVDIHSTVKT